MSVPTQLISPRTSKPCMSVVQDGVIGSYLLTDKDTFLDRAQFFDLSMHVKYNTRALPNPAIMYKSPDGRWNTLYTGKQLATYVAPHHITFTKSTRSFESESHSVGEKAMDPDERFVVVSEGALLAGRLCKATIGSVSRGMVHRIHYRHGTWAAAKWISDLQRVVTHFLSGYGFSVGMEDCVPSAEIETKVAEVVQRSVDAVYAGTAAAREAGVAEERIEAERMRVLSDVMLKSAQVVLRHVDPKNNILRCIQSGSKGKKLNICQILGVLGQQIHSGSRIHNKVNPTGRTLTCFDDEDMLDPRTHGLVGGSYRMGLDPAAFFFHCMTGREGLIDTACKTAETGYLQRRIGKILESDHVATDMSVRDGDNNLIMTVYGGDGIDPEKQLKIPLKLLTARGDPEEAAARWCGRRAHEREIVELANALSAVRSAFQDATGSVGGELYIPFDPEAERPLPQGHVQIEWGELGPMLDHAVRVIRNMQTSGSVHFELAIRAYFTCSRLGCVSAAAVRAALLKVTDRIQRAAAAPGMMCGTIAAQSIGEPATQMTLVRRILSHLGPCTNQPPRIALIPLRKPIYFTFVFLQHTEHVPQRRGRQQDCPAGGASGKGDHRHVQEPCYAQYGDLFPPGNRTQRGGGAQNRNRNDPEDSARLRGGVHAAPCGVRLPRKPGDAGRRRGSGVHTQCPVPRTF